MPVRIKKRRPPRPPVRMQARLPKPALVRTANLADAVAAAEAEDVLAAKRARRSPRRRSTKCPNARIVAR
jgi:hypothetical protein